jgi:uncharacterized membrane-anchored protein
MLARAREYGGLGFGTVYTSAGFLAVIIALVAWLTIRATRTPLRRAGALPLRQVMRE